VPKMLSVVWWILRGNRW